MKYLPTSSGHWAEVNGIVVPSLTTILQGGGPKPPWVLKWVINHCVGNNLNYDQYVKGEQSEALRVGTKTHNIIEQMFEGEEILVEDDPEVQKALTSFMVWYKKHKPKPVAIEEFMYCEDLNDEGNLLYPFCGTADLVYENKEGELVLADFKTSKQLDANMGIQLSGYKMLWDATHDRKIDKLAIILLKKNFLGSKPSARTEQYYEYDFDPRAVSCVSYLFALHNANKDGVMKPTYKPNLIENFSLEVADEL